MPEKQTDQLGRRFKTITGDLKLYVEKRLELLLLNVGEQYSKWIAESVQKVAGLILLFGALVFLLMALALYLGELLDSLSLGYLIVSIPLIITGLLFYFLKPKSLVENLQRHFESELVNALTPNGKGEKETLNLPEHTEENIS